jgi:hypothetical protein
MENSKTKQRSTGYPSDNRHDAIKSVLGFLIEMNVYDIGCNMTPLSQKPARSKKNDPQKGIFGCLHNPYRRLGKQESHADGVTDSGTYEYEDCPGQGCHYFYKLIKKIPESFHIASPTLSNPPRFRVVPTFLKGGRGGII